MPDFGFGGLGGAPIELANSTPMPEATSAAAGVSGMATRADHRHPRLTSAGSGTLNASGEATITFTRSFSSMPSMDFCWIEAADAQPVILKVKSWTMDGSNFVGCVAKGYRSQAIPQNLATLLLGGIFNLFAGSASGVTFTYIALQPTTV